MTSLMIEYDELTRLCEIDDQDAVLKVSPSAKCVSACVQLENYKPLLWLFKLQATSPLSMGLFSTIIIAYPRMVMALFQDFTRDAIPLACVVLNLQYIWSEKIVLESIIDGLTTAIEEEAISTRDLEGIVSTPNGALLAATILLTCPSVSGARAQEVFMRHWIDMQHDHVSTHMIRRLFEVSACSCEFTLFTWFYEKIVHLVPIPQYAILYERALVQCIIFVESHEKTFNVLQLMEYSYTTCILSKADYTNVLDYAVWLIENGRMYSIQPRVFSSLVSYLAFSAEIDSVTQVSGRREEVIRSLLGSTRPPSRHMLEAEFIESCVLTTAFPEDARKALLNLSAEAGLLKSMIRHITCIAKLRPNMAGMLEYAVTTSWFKRAPKGCSEEHLETLVTMAESPTTLEMIQSTVPIPKIHLLGLAMMLMRHSCVFKNIASLPLDGAIYIQLCLHIVHNLLGFNYPFVECGVPYSMKEIWIYAMNTELEWLLTHRQDLEYKCQLLIQALGRKNIDFEMPGLYTMVRSAKTNGVAVELLKCLDPETDTAIGDRILSEFFSEEQLQRGTVATSMLFENVHFMGNLTLKKLLNACPIFADASSVMQNKLSEYANKNPRRYACSIVYQFAVRPSTALNLLKLKTRLTGKIEVNKNAIILGEAEYTLSSERPRAPRLDEDISMKNLELILFTRVVSLTSRPRCGTCRADISRGGMYAGPRNAHGVYHCAACHAGIPATATECSVCLSQDSVEMRITQCGHVYCKTCIASLRATPPAVARCPMCRESIVKYEEVQASTAVEQFLTEIGVSD